MNDTPSIGRRMRAIATENPSIQIDTVTAWWVVCIRCNDSELVYGSTADADATTWTEQHIQMHLDEDAS